MDEKMIEPTVAMILEAASTGARLGTDARAILRAALNHPDAAGLFECDHTDYVHVDEAATRVEAAREQGWDDAAQHIYNKGWEGVAALRKANPHRPAPELPTEDGAVIVPADGHEYIEAVVNGHTYYAREAMLINGLWRAVWRTPHCFQVSYSVLPWKITPGTWKVDGEDSA